jgi:hypothetical protein
VVLVNIDKILDLCVDMLLFLNRNDLEGEPNVGVRLERDDGEWHLDFRDYNDESICSKSGNNLEALLTETLESLRKRLLEESTEAIKLMQRAEKIGERVET